VDIFHSARYGPSIWTGHGLTRFAVLFVIDLTTRRVEIAGIVSEPDSAWMSQVSRNVTDATEASYGASAS
jgi:hypothetical protein